MLLKLLVKDKLPHIRKVPMNAKEWQLKLLRKETRLQRMKDRLAAETPKEKDQRSKPSIACLMGSMPIANM